MRSHTERAVPSEDLARAPSAGRLASEGVVGQALAIMAVLAFLYTAFIFLDRRRKPGIKTSLDRWHVWSSPDALFADMSARLGLASMPIEGKDGLARGCASRAPSATDGAR